MAVRQRKAAGGSSGAGGTGAAESPYTELERALKETYEAAKGGRTPSKLASIGLGGLTARVYAEAYRSDIVELEERRVIFEVRSRGDGGDELPLCSVWLKFKYGEPYKFDVDCGILGSLASRCARGEGCELSWEEARTALGLAVWAASRLAELAGIPAKVERTGLVEAYDIGDGELHVLPCLQVSMNGKGYSMCQGLHLSRNTSGSWRVEGGFRLVPIGEAHIKIAEALMELEEMVKEHIWNRENEGAERIHIREHRGEFLGLEEVVLRRPDGAEEVLLKPVLPRLYYLGEGLAVVECSFFFDACMKSGDSELADTIKKELEEGMGKVVQAVRRYMETGDPRYTALAYIVAEALRKAGLVPA